MGQGFYRALVACSLLGSFATDGALAQRAKRDPAAATTIGAQGVEVPPGQTVSAMDTARYLAGMPQAAGSPLTAASLEPLAQAHAKFFDAEWAGLEARQLSKIRSFVARVKMPKLRCAICGATQTKP